MNVPLLEVSDSTEPISYGWTKQSAHLEKPQSGAQYLVAVDTAAGLSNEDFSCTSVLRLHLQENRLCFRLAAQYHGSIGLHDYADEVFKLAVAL